MRSIVQFVGRIIEFLFFIIFVYLFDLLWTWGPIFTWARGCAFLSLALAFLFFFVLLRKTDFFGHWKSPYFLLLFLGLGAMLWGVKFIRLHKSSGPDFFKAYSNCRPWTSEILKAEYFENLIYNKNPKLLYYAKELEEFCRGGILAEEVKRVQATGERPSFCKGSAQSETTNACFLKYVNELYRTVPASSFARFYSMGMVWKKMNGVADSEPAPVEAPSKEASFVDRAKKLMGVQVAVEKMNSRIEAMMQGKDPGTIEFNYQKDVWEPYYENEKSRFMTQPSIKWIYEQLKGFELVESTK